MRAHPCRADPGAAKALGREVENFVEAEWEAHRFDIVVRGNAGKFAQNAELRTYLLHTGEKVLVEASPVDLIWGAGVAAEDPCVESPDRWPGANLLGFALMKYAQSFVRRRESVRSTAGQRCAWVLSPLPR